MCPHVSFAIPKEPVRGVMRAASRLRRVRTLRVRRAIYTCVRLQQHAVHAREAGASRAWATMVPRVGHLPEGSARKGNVQGCCAARFRPDRWLLAVSTLTALRFLHL
jgi:hypothetical protein